MRELSREQHTYIAEIAKISSDGYGNKTVCLTNVDDGCGNIVEHIWVKTQTALQKKIFARYLGKKVRLSGRGIEYRRIDGTRDMTLKINTIIGGA